ncbi:RrF2 family transcriptional regulator [Pseudomonadota bacterium]
MHLTTFTEHAFRVLMYLAKNNNSQATIQEISESYKVSRNHIAKVVHQLGLSGFILTNRGARGGIRLAKEATEIHAINFVKAKQQAWHKHY